MGDERLKRWGISPILVGSYGRDVSIRRTQDVDVFPVSSCTMDANPPSRWHSGATPVDQQHPTFAAGYVAVVQR